MLQIVYANFVPLCCLNRNVKREAQLLFLLPPGLLFNDSHPLMLINNFSHICLHFPPPSPYPGLCRSWMPNMLPKVFSISAGVNMDLKYSIRLWGIWCSIDHCNSGTLLPALPIFDMSDFQYHELSAIDLKIFKSWSYLLSCRLLHNHVDSFISFIGNYQKFLIFFKYQTHMYAVVVVVVVSDFMSIHASNFHKTKVLHFL